MHVVGKENIYVGQKMKGHDFMTTKSGSSKEIAVADILELHLGTDSQQVVGVLLCTT